MIAGMLDQAQISKGQCHNAGEYQGQCDDYRTLRIEATGNTSKRSPRSIRKDMRARS